MPYHIKLSESAELDLIDIGNYTIEHYGIDQMHKYLNDIDHAIQLVLENPNIGHSHAELPPEYQVWQVKHHYLIYMIDGETIYILRIPNTKRNLKQLLR
jgi:plasmid stabilization system protein ParE